MALFDLSSLQLFIVLTTLVVAYSIFGMVGFGTSLLASPILVHFFTLPQIIALLALLDLLAACIKLRDYSRLRRDEVFRILPWMLLGNLCGFTLLASLPSAGLAFGLGLFAAFYGLYALLDYKTQRVWPAKASTVFGVVGGVFSALFGSGGFVYAVYLTGRLNDKHSFSSTQSALIGLSTVIRVGFFAVLGTYFTLDFVWALLLALPCMFMGLWLGSQLRSVVNAAVFLRVVFALVLLSGMGLVLRSAVLG